MTNIFIFAPNFFFGVSKRLYNNLFALELEGLYNLGNVLVLWAVQHGI